MRKIFVVLLALLPVASHAEEIGRVDTAFNWVGSNKHIAIEAFDDPKVQGVTCYVSMARQGGISGAVGMAEETSDASIACRQTGPISFPQPLKQEDEMFSERISLIFKKLRVVRMVDAPRNTLIYLTYSDRVIEGSPQNSLTAVAVDRGTPIPLEQ